MSIRAVLWVIERSPAKRGERLVHIALAYLADDAMVCWPSLPEIARRAGITVQATITNIKRLEERGAIVVTRDRGDRRPNLYRLVGPLDGEDAE